MPINCNQHEKNDLLDLAPREYLGLFCCQQQKYNSIKVPLTPQFVLNRDKTLFGVDYFGEELSVKGLFLDFL